MPALALLIPIFFSALTRFLFALFAGRAALALLGVGALTALGYEFVAYFNTAISPLVAGLFSNPYGQVIGLAFPPVAGTCVATTLAALLFAAAYKLKVRVVDRITGV